MIFMDQKRKIDFTFFLIKSKAIIKVRTWSNLVGNLIGSAYGRALLTDQNVRSPFFSGLWCAVYVRIEEKHESQELNSRSQISKLKD